MRVWIDVSNSPQVLFFRPLIALLESRGHTVDVSARDYAQTVELLRLHGIRHEVVGPPHGGAGRWGKARAMAGRLPALRSWAKRRSFDIAFSHASHELSLTARSLGVPAAYAFDYEFALVQHGFGCRAARRVVVPEAIPQERLDRLGARESKVRRYAGLKEEYYLSGFAPDPLILDRLGLDATMVIVVARTPPDVSLYHLHDNVLFGAWLSELGSNPSVRTVVLPRTEVQREAIGRLDLPSLVIPEQAIDAQSLLASADLVVSAGGTMNREAVALGVPAYTTFAGRLGAVDQQLIRDGRLHVLRSPVDLQVRKRAEAGTSRVERDPALLLDLMFTTR